MGVLLRAPIIALCTVFLVYKCPTTRLCLLHRCPDFACVDTSHVLTLECVYHNNCVSALLVNNIVLIALVMCHLSHSVPRILRDEDSSGSEEDSSEGRSLGDGDVVVEKLRALIQVVEQCLQSNTGMQSTELTRASQSLLVTYDGE